MNRDDIERRKKLSVELGKYILDITKLVFAGVILTSIMDSTIDKLYLFLVGMIVVILGFLIGFALLNYGLKKNKRK